MNAYQKEKRRVLKWLMIGAIPALMGIYSLSKDGNLFTMEGLLVPMALIYPLGIAYSWRAFLWATDVADYDRSLPYTFKEQRNQNGIILIIKLALVFSFGWFIGLFIACLKLNRAKKSDKLVNKAA